MLKRFPEDYTRKELVDLIAHHHKRSVDASTALYNLRKKHDALIKKVPTLKQNRGLGPAQADR